MDRVLQGKLVADVFVVRCPSPAILRTITLMRIWP
jgi:hypothetical protein